MKLSMTDLAAIHAGLSTIIFALIIFIAQSSREYENRIRVLLKVSFLYPLLIATILGFFNFIWGKISFGNIVFTFGICAFLILSVYRLVLILLDKHLYFEKYLELLEYDSNKEFKRIMDPNIDDTHERFRSELKDHRDKFIGGINSNHIGKVEESFEIYQVLINTLVDSFKNCKTAKLSDENIKILKERFDDIIRWFSEDIYEIFKIGMSSQNIDIVSKVDSLTILAAWKGIDIENSSLFEEFLKFKILFYESSKDKPKKFKSTMVEKTWRHLKETSQLLKIKLEKNEYNSHSTLKDFAVYLFIILQDLLGEATEQNDLESYKKFNNTVKNLFKNFRPSQKLENRVILETIEKEIDIRKKQMFFWLATWIFHKFAQDQTNTDLEEFFLEAYNSLPNTFGEFTKVFLSSHTIDADNFWRWILWEEIPEDRTITVGTMSRLERFYAIGALKMLKNMPPNRIEKIKLHYDDEEYNKDLAYLAEDEAFIKLLDNIAKKPEKWEFILEQDEIDCINVFKTILEKSKDIWKQIERKKIIKNKISPEKVEEFKEEVLKEFNESSTLRNIFKHFDLYENKINEINEEKSIISLNLLDDKAVFFEKWHIEYGNWGMQYGRSLALEEDNYILKEILNQCNEISDTDFKKTFDKFDELSEVIIFITDLKSREFIEESDKYGPNYTFPETNLNKVKGFEGYYSFNEKNIPVFSIYNNEIKSVLILNKSELGNLIQYSPLKKGENVDLIKDIFCLYIESFYEDKELLNQFLNEPPEWLEKEGDEDQQRKYLEVKVRILIFERLEYKGNENTGYYIKF